MSSHLRTLIRTLIDIDTEPDDETIESVNQLLDDLQTPPDEGGWEGG
jgi:hypothetical protein